MINDILGKDDILSENNILDMITFTICDIMLVW